MRSLIKKGLSLLMKIIGVLYPYTLRMRLRGYKNLLFTYWLFNFLGNVGESTIIEKPCLIMGDGSKISIGNRTIIQSHSVLGAYARYRDKAFNPSITIGNDCSVGEYNHITAIGNVSIGDGFLSGRFVIISDNNHGGLSKEEASLTPLERGLKSKGGISIGKNVWVGDKASILSGVSIGDNVVIAANSVVTRDLPSNCIAGGIPARIIKRL